MFFTDRLLDIGWPWATNQLVNHLIGNLAPEACFVKANSWPGNRLPWTPIQTAVTVSFDCESIADAQAFERLLPLLSRLQIRASFAVIGSLVEADSQQYLKLLDESHEVLCHGYQIHTEDNNGSANSNLFLHDLPWDAIEEEILKGKKAIVEALGITPIGFRSPHFGSFQSRGQIEKLYAILEKHGFLYSSSMLIWHAQRQRRLDGNRNLKEFPLSAKVGPPISLIDSWNYIVKDNRRGRAPRLEREWDRAITTATASPEALYLNFYFDPSHVIEYLPFESMLAMIANLRDKRQIWIGSYDQALGEAE